MASENKDPFESAKKRLRRGNQHVARTKKRVEKFFRSNPYAKVVEIDADGVTQLHKIKLTKPFPESPTESALEALDALRSVLDQAGYAAAILSGKESPKKTHFPFADTKERLENIVAKQCRDLPQEIIELFRSFEPYRDGNQALWAMNKIRNSTHTALIPVGVAVDGLHMNSGFMAAGESGSVAIHQPVWNSAKNEMIFASVGPNSSFEYDMNINFKVIFDDADIAPSQSAIRLLELAATEVAHILKATEAECYRIGLLK
ncbi:MAG: hypothetical protein H6883_10430 [Rhodobiaceae bacterium]|nr:hypothetical protein [Rhodobiaceae bacterium]MCC0056544.1 hypothetical protein [Rhodobiaceae bacterium]